MGNITQNLRPTPSQNGTILSQPMTSGIMTAPTNFVRVNQSQPMQTQQQQGQFTAQTVWTNNLSQSSQPQFTIQKQAQQPSVLQYTTVKTGMI